MTGPDEAGIVLVCGPDGDIVDVLRDDLGLAAEGATTLADLLHKGSRSKGRRFLDRLTDRGEALGWELLVATDPPRELYFGGGPSGEGWVVIGAGSERGATDLFTEMMAISNEQANVARRMAEDRRDAKREASTGRLDPMSELSQVNNELTNLQRELARKNAELERLGAQKDRFLGMAAHDLRNPLGIILGYARFLLGDRGPELEPNQRRFLETIGDQARFMTRLVEDLLDISAIESGALVLEAEEVDLLDLVERNVALNQTLAADKDIEVRTDLPEDGLVTRVDPSKIEQVLNNLVSNAVKFSESGSAVTVRVAVEDDGVVLEVADRGQGIPAEEQARLFKPFSRTSVKSTAGEASTGLGLAITKRIVEAHGGTIGVSSTVGEGSTFRIELPRGGVPPEDDESSDTADPGPDSSTADTGPDPSTADADPDSSPG